MIQRGWFYDLMLLCRSVGGRLTINLSTFQVGDSQKKQPASQAPWVKCPWCQDFWCTIHRMHVHDCDCDPIELWDTDPYEEKTMLEPRGSHKTNPFQSRNGQDAEMTNLSIGMGRDRRNSPLRKLWLMAVGALIGFTAAEILIWLLAR